MMPMSESDHYDWFHYSCTCNLFLSFEFLTLHMLWFKDPGNIGKKLLTQMGWEKGKGLGLNEQGEKDPIKVHMNRESRGG